MADMKRIGGNVRKVYKWNDAPSERPLHSTKAPSAQPVRRRSAKRSNTAALLQWILIAFVVCVMVLLSIFAISFPGRYSFNFINDYFGLSGFYILKNLNCLRP